MKYEDTNKLQTHYINDLLNQKEALKDALTYQNIYVAKNEGLINMIPKVKTITGKDNYLPVIKLKNSTDNPMTKEELDAFLYQVNLNNLKDLSYFINNITTSSIDLSNLSIKPNTPVTRMIYSVGSDSTDGANFKLKFSKYNDLTGISNLNYMVRITSSNWGYGGGFKDDISLCIDYSSFRLDETLILKTHDAFDKLYKLPSNYYNCTFSPCKYNFGACRWALHHSEEYYDMEKMKFAIHEGNYDSGNSYSNTLFSECFQGGHFDKIIFDFDLNKIKNVDKTKKHTLGPVFSLISSVNKIIFKNKDKVPEWISSIELDIDGRGYGGGSVLDLSGLNLSHVTNFGTIFEYGGASTIDLTNVDTSNMIYFNNVIGSSSAITTILGEFDGSSLLGCDLSGSYGATGLKNFNGFKNYGKAFTEKKANKYSCPFGKYSGLSYESAISIINNLYDLNITYGVYDEEGNPGEGVLYTQSVSFHSNVKSKLTPEEIAIATNKGWTLS